MIMSHSKESALERRPSCRLVGTFPLCMAPTDEFSDLPLLLTVEEVARLFRLGRSTAYERVNLYLDTAGVDGYPGDPDRFVDPGAALGPDPVGHHRGVASHGRAPRRVGLVDAARLKRVTADLVIGAGAAGVRRALGPTSWVVLEELLLASEPADDGPASTRSCALSVRDLARRLGLDKDTVARAVQRLIDAGHVARSQTRTTAGTFARTTYRIDLPDGLHLLDGCATPDLPAAPATSRTPHLTDRPDHHDSDLRSYPPCPLHLTDLALLPALLPRALTP